MFYEIENRVKCWELVSGFADLVCGPAVWVSFRNCVRRKDFVKETAAEKWADVKCDYVYDWHAIAYAWCLKQCCTELKPLFTAVSSTEGCEV